jgi:SAM-dependent methyltransferase
MDEPRSRSEQSAPGPAVHSTALGFDRVADVYERSRPDYPAPAVDALAARLGAAPGRRIVDLGAGTGKLTVPLLATGCDVVAVEPMPSMRERLQGLVAEEYRDHLEVVDASAEDLPFPDGSVDGAAAAQAFHWFDAIPALAEVRRVLAPGGWFAVVHNRRDLTTGAQATLEDLLRPHRADTPSWVDTTWSDPLEEADGFAPAELLTFPNVQRMDAEGFVGRVASVSFVAKLPDTTRRQILEAARLLFTMLERDGVVDLEYVTELRLLHRLDE